MRIYGILYIKFYNMCDITCQSYRVKFSVLCPPMTIVSLLPSRTVTLAFIGKENVSNCIFE